MECLLRNLKLSGHVGFDSLPSQLVNKSVQNGFLFNILCIGMIIINFNIKKFTVYLSTNLIINLSY